MGTPPVCAHAQKTHSHALLTEGMRVAAGEKNQLHRGLPLGARAGDGGGLLLQTGLSCAPKFLGWSSDPPAPQNVAVFGEGVFKEVIKVSEVIGWPLTQCDWCSQKSSGHRQAQRAAT